MFIGIVQAQVKVLQLQKFNGFIRLTLRAGASRLQHLQADSQVTVHGTCLNITYFDQAAGWGSFHVPDKILRESTLGTLQQGCWVSFERSYKFASDTFVGDHCVDDSGRQISSGYGNTTTHIVEIRHSANNCVMQLSFPPCLSLISNRKELL